jgi:hypothetical protein
MLNLTASDGHNQLPGISSGTASDANCDDVLELSDNVFASEFVMGRGRLDGTLTTSTTAGWWHQQKDL